MQNKMVYVVTIPWDSYRVDSSRGFSNKEDARKYADKLNEKGYNGYIGGIEIKTCEIETNE